jgi:hypothetical protein
VLVVSTFCGLPPESIFFFPFSSTARPIWRKP